jgi:hypothetical protein
LKVLLQTPAAVISPTVENMKFLPIIVGVIAQPCYC